MAKPTREEVERLIGKRTPLPSGRRGGNWDVKPGPTPVERPVADFEGVLNPKRVTEKRLVEAEKGMKSGGKVRGSGCASRGFGKGAMR